MSDGAITIVGAGPCGIGAAWTLQHDYPSQRFVVVEATSSVGGNAASFTTPEGFTFDYGGHVLFPHQNYHNFAALLKLWVRHWSASCPVRGVYIYGRLIPAPIQRNVHALPASLFALIVGDLLWGRLGRRFRGIRQMNLSTSEISLDRYLREAFGRQLARLVMEPLNRKMWAVPPQELSDVWVHQRSGSHLSNIAQVGLGRLLNHAFRRTSDPGWDANTIVEYPQRGGSGAVWVAAASKLRQGSLHLGKRITTIVTRERRLIFDDGSSQSYSYLISSMPLDLLLRSCVDRPDLLVFARKLRYSRAQLFGFGVDGEVPPAFRHVHSFHCPEPTLPFWRVTIPSNFSLGNVPADRPSYSILCEVSSDASRKVSAEESSELAVREGLQCIGLLPAHSAIRSRFQAALDHGYPLPFLDRDNVLATIHDQLERLSIFSRGRFGGWRYEVSNQDHAFNQGAEVIHRIMTGRPEVTYAQATGRR